MKTLLIIIVNYNGLHNLKNCLPSIKKQENVIDFDICLVDNGSKDASVQYYKRIFPKGHTIIFNSNKGFAYPNTFAWEKFKNDYEYFFLLNNDAILEENFFSKLKKIIKEKPGVIAPLMLDYYNPDKIDNAGFHPTIWGIFIHNLKNKSITFLKSSEQEIFGGCAGAIILNGKLLKEINLFEKSFFAYYEDVELALRINMKKKWKTKIYKELIVYHKHSQTLKNDPIFKKYLIHRNQLRCLIRNYPLSLLAIFSPFILFYILITCTINTIKYKTSSFIKARIDALKFLKEDLKYRQQFNREDFKNLQSKIFKYLRKNHFFI